ncbi:MAG TPA: NADH-quinone oxidoreductase subunit NuoB [Methanomassiliicoccales archaeon]|nr:NADH-quinone oxidoreductase subunit NuoB [Methanomassiliicoccales archaeon]HPR98147.1 NADH-quinone oxidoreductase subunit NuoB [Methanomassiliicoccales archaeon]HSA36040.1 NADH-quinone oxidoreductase subunit NuoB [Methanomassiliicoccales archaeon]
MDIDLSFNAMTMTAKQFGEMTKTMMRETMVATGGKKVVDKITAPIWSWGQRNSVYPLHFGIACCALEMAAAGGPRYDAERLGIVFRSSPRQSDVLLLNGWISAKLRPSLKALYEQMPGPKWVIAMGECTISGGPWYDAYNVIQGADTFIPVDVYIPGCPSRPEAMIQAFNMLNRKLTAENRGSFLDD